MLMQRFSIILNISKRRTPNFEEANAEKNDRGAAILIATNLENALESAIIRQLQLGSKRRDLFGLNSPGGTFDFKIRIGHALRIFGDETRGNLDMIRSIRNTFAHAKIPIQFTEPAVTKACALLVIPRLLPPVSRPVGWQPEIQEELAAIQGKKRFERVCNDTAHNLIVRSLGGPHEIARESLREIGMVADAYTVLAIQKPLP